jgi:uncharacterized RDD family membrane protein YckC
MTKTSTTTPPKGWTYASFSIRALAFTIDEFILLIIALLLALPVGVIFFLEQAVAWPFVAFVFLPSLSGFTTLLAWMYFTLQECSKHQATWGKRICGLRVADTNGKRMTFSRATVRYFSKFLSAALMMIGFIMAAFTERHQALHDLIAETVVLKKKD